MKNRNIISQGLLHLLLNMVKCALSTNLPKFVKQYTFVCESKVVRRYFLPKRKCEDICLKNRTQYLY